MKTISLPVYRRADRTRRLLETLRACKPEGYSLFVAAEPGYPEVVESVKAVDFMPVTLSLNTEKLGLNENVKKTLMMAMDAGSEFNVALEDDIVLAPDALRLADWFMRFPESSAYACMGLFAYASTQENPLEVTETYDFRSWGWCSTRRGWEEYILPGLFFEPFTDPETKFRVMWDFKMQYYLIMAHARTLHPTLSRSNHEGFEDGTNDLECIRHFFTKPEVSDGSHGSSYYVTRRTPQIVRENKDLKVVINRERVSA